ncbi:MAG TPA: adenylate/guanylate cyclase domain-containing protein [Casimicrobiaceae bacterium]|nr:adenylate/guanylate cyclase domain-containing protein [Casimicrobiaceae bacterium]
MSTPPTTPLPDSPAGDASASSPQASAAGPDAGRANPYVARILQEHLVADPDGRAWISEGTAVFVDISGFTRLSEQLARKGREGAEQIAGIIGQVFQSLLAVGYESGGSLIKFGGDALLLWFEGASHAERACRATVQMRELLRDVGRVELPDATITLKMSQGVHSGRFHFFAVGTSHLELLTTGPAWSRLVAMEQGADADEILVSPETAGLLPSECLDAPKGPGILLRQEPPGFAEKLPLKPRPHMAPDRVLHCLPSAIRAHIQGGGGTPEHRPVTIAFIRFDGMDALIEQKGTAAATEALHRLVTSVEAAAEAQNVAFLASDVDADGGKLILAAGAPKASGDDEEHMLLALRGIIDSNSPIPIRIGVHRGSVFAGDIGATFRRTYTVMGDAVNLTARVMAKAEPGHVYATADVLDRSNTLFDVAKLEPFAVKGKEEPIQAWSLGRPQGSRTRQASIDRLPLTGRNVELGIVRKAFASARSGAGRVLEVSGEAGMGKTRLLEALRDAAAGFTKVQGTCEAYTASTPYALWREMLREFMGFGRDDPEAAIVDRLSNEVASKAPDLAPWLPLIGIAFGLDIEPTPEVQLLAEKNRRAKLHESVGRFLDVAMSERMLVEIENAQHMDEASVDLLTHVVGSIGSRPWLFAVARRPSDGGFKSLESENVVKIELKALAAADALRLAQLATKDNPLPEHALAVVATRSGGNPQFLRDLLRTAIASGGVADLPDSAEAAAIARIDALAPDDRSVVRHAAVFGITFHPRMFEWFEGESDFRMPTPETWKRLADLFDEEPDGYLRFRRSLLRDAAYEGLPFKLRRQLHGAVAARLESEMDFPEEVAGTLALHYFEAGEYRPAWEYAAVAAKAAEDVYSYVEAAGFYTRAVEAARRLGDAPEWELAELYEALGDAWHRAGEWQKAGAAFGPARELAAGNALADATLLIKLSKVEEKLGKIAEAQRFTEQARGVLLQLPGPDAASQAAWAAAWLAYLLGLEGRMDKALECAAQAATEAETIGDAEAEGEACFVMGWASGDLGKADAQSLMQRALEAFVRSGNLPRQASLLMNLGVICGWEGRWDEAISFFERSRDAALKIGSTIAAAQARLNIADILIDRGEWAEAETLLLEILPFWRASGYQDWLAACLQQLGRVAMRLRRFDDAMGRFEEAKALLLHVGAEHDIPPVDANTAECRVGMGNPDAALELARGLLERAGESNVSRLVPLLERVQGHALMLQDDLWGARDALEASLAAARERKDLFEATLTSLSLIELDRLEGVEPPAELVNETRTLLASRKVRAVPPVPLPPR